MQLKDIGPHDAETLAHWRRIFLDAHRAVRALGVDARFFRNWLLYGYCEGGFREQDTNSVQVPLASRARAARHLAGHNERKALSCHA